ncbi:non-homologous end-joining DNA ligase [Actinospongicola halichondriae]|uniref:non-homologous end-joining DNA ligase n=1 Tax=Actinospongicola halichondriae TaxID=3236844 RepID=UPI003D54DA37
MLEIDGREVRITSPDKVFFPERGETKLDLVHHYLRVAEPILRTMGGRPTLMQRFPDGADGKSFFQKRVPKGAPDWLQTTVVSTPNGTTSDAMVVADIAHLAWAVNMGCLGFHPWPLRADDPGTTDELRIDLDPGPGVDFAMLREAAHELHTLLDELGIRSFPKTTGNRGIHVYARLAPGWDSYDVRAAAVVVGRLLEQRRPELVTAAWWKEERGSRVFVDFNQNAPHKTVFGAWCVRPRVGGQVSTPFHWDELDDIEPDELTIPVVAERMTTVGDPWATIDDEPQAITPLLERYEADLAAGVGDAPWPPVYPKMPNEPSRVAPSRAKGAEQS